MNTFSPIGQENFLRLIRNRFQGRLHTVADAHKVLRFLAEEISQIALPPVTGMELFLADGYNLDCTYCFEGRKPKRLLSPELAQLAVKRLILDWSERSESVRLLLFGGEPLLNWRVCRLVIECAEEQAAMQGKQVFFSMTTNGTLLNEERVRFLREHQVAIMLSMDGVPDAHNRHRWTKRGLPSFPLVQRGLKLLCEHYGTFDVRMTVMPDTAPMLYESVMFLAEQGAKKIVAIPAFEVQWTPQDWHVYRQQVRKIVAAFRNSEPESEVTVSLVQDVAQTRTAMEQVGQRTTNESANFGCHAGITSVTVTALGEVFPCSTFVGDERLRESYRLGTVQEGKLDIFRRQELFVLSRQRGRRCQDCSLKAFCSGGCMVANYRATGYLIEPDPTTCWRTQLCVNLARREVTYVNCLSPPSTGR
ncbi:radical SAM protein [Fervidibacter sacchari]|uniref:Radical SAM core domain-containing protein n=1 Tax=Candidatus Fervidibacter sacchari TaxID=1448929 RepID=A0ABT2EME2_9BACT|nr:radical SAM protein [Candidatus Fervidibacter sacchari]MCS3919117.1 uncharacterized protein [Candidatus Fervidibacter sacchari]WKU17151.1 radical SAM protein [Candidatus Fervidibacter sacchari]